MILGKYQCGYWKTGQMIYLLQKRAIGNTASQYRSLCNIVLYSISLCFHHQTHPQLSIISALGHFLELFLFSSPVVYWTPNDLGSTSSGVISFCLFILLLGFSRQEYWNGLPFPFPWTTFCLWRGLFYCDIKLLGTLMGLTIR